MQIHRVLFTMVLGLIVTANCFAQDDARAKKQKAKALKSSTKQIMRQFKAAELTDEQKEKATAIIEKHIDSVIEARKASEGLLSDEQKEKRKAGIAAAKEEGLKGNKATNAGIAAMGLSEEKLKEFKQSRNKVKAANAKISAAIKELLTEEQIAALPKKGKRKKMKDAATTTQTVSLKLPGMT